MGEKYITEFMPLPGSCDSFAKLSEVGTFNLFQDVATAHAEIIGVGLKVMAPEHRYWLTAKTRLVFHRRPDLGEKVTVSTWPQMHRGIRCMREYAIKAGDELLIAGETQWAVINTETGSLEKVDEIYPKGLDIDEKAVEGGFTMLKDFEGELLGSYTIVSCDIDVGKHMNNVAYLRAFQSMYSVEEWDALHPSSIEIHFKNSCFEGEVLTFYTMEKDGILHVKGCVGDRIAVLMAVES